MPKKKLARTKTKTKNNYIKYHNDGTIWAQGTIVDGKPEGYWEWFRKTGTRMRSGYFERGKQVGKWTTYDSKGEIFKVTQIKQMA